MIGRKHSSRLVAETLKVRGTVRELQREPANQARKNHSRKRRETLNAIGFLLFEQSLPKWPPFMEKKCGNNAVLVENFNSTFKFEPLFNLQLKLPRLLKTCFIHFLSSDEMYSHLLGPLGKRNRFTSMRVPPLKLCSGVLSHIEEKYPVHGLSINFTRKKQPAQMHGLSPKEGLRGMMEGRGYYAFNAVLLFVAALIDRSPGLVEKCNMPPMFSLYAEMVSKVLFDQRVKA